MEHISIVPPICFLSCMIIKPNETVGIQLSRLNQIQRFSLFTSIILTIYISIIVVCFLGIFFLSVNGQAYINLQSPFNLLFNTFSIIMHVM